MMKKAEDEIIEESLRLFGAKYERFEQLRQGRDASEFIGSLISGIVTDESADVLTTEKLESADLLGEQIREMPVNKVPVVLLGGSFNSSSHSTAIKKPMREMLADLVGMLDPEKAFFVIGNRLTGYEQELVKLSDGRFEIFAIVPTRIRLSEAQRLKRSGVYARVSIEPTRMGLYKSFAYEIFKRRPSVVIALDGNSAGANTVQEAKNGKKKARIFVNRHSRVLNAKAQTIQGYVSIFDGKEVAVNIAEAVEKTFNENSSLLGKAAL